MKKLLYLFLSLLLLVVGFTSFKISIPFFEIKQTVSFRKYLIENGVNFDLGGVFVSEVAPNSPASENGIIVNSQITNINGKPIDNSAKFLIVINDNLGKSVSLTSCRLSGCHLVKVVPRIKSPEGNGPLGIVIHDISTYNQTGIKLVYNEIHKRFTGNDFYSTIFGKRVAVQSWFLLISGIISTILSVKLIVNLDKNKHFKTKE